MSAFPGTGNRAATLLGGGWHAQSISDYGGHDFDRTGLPSTQTYASLNFAVSPLLFQPRETRKRRTESKRCPQSSQSAWPSSLLRGQQLSSRELPGLSALFPLESKTASRNDNPNREAFVLARVYWGLPVTRAGGPPSPGAGRSGRCRRRGCVSA